MFVGSSFFFSSSAQCTDTQTELPLYTVDDPDYVSACRPPPPPPKQRSSHVFSRSFCLLRCLAYLV